MSDITVTNISENFTHKMAAKTKPPCQVLFGVDGSCAKHLTVESYTVVMLLAFILTCIIISFPSPAHSFIPGLNPSFSANPSHLLPSFLLQN